MVIPEASSTSEIAGTAGLTASSAQASGEPNTPSAKAVTVSRLSLHFIVRSPPFRFFESSAGDTLLPQAATRFPKCRAESGGGKKTPGDNHHVAGRPLTATRCFPHAG